MPLYVYDCPRCGGYEESRAVSRRDDCCSRCGGAVRRELSLAAPISARGLQMSGDEVRSRGMHQMMMDNKTFCESPKGQAMIREGGIELRGPKEYHPVLPKEFH